MFFSLIAHIVFVKGFCVCFIISSPSSALIRRVVIEMFSHGRW